MPTLFKRSNGVYYAIFTDEFGRRKWISTKEHTKQAALKKLPEITERKKEKLPRITLAKFFADFTAYGKGVYLPETLSIYNRALRKFLEITGDRLLPLVSARHMWISSKQNASRRSLRSPSILNCVRSRPPSTRLCGGSSSRKIHVRA